MNPICLSKRPTVFSCFFICDALCTESSRWSPCLVAVLFMALVLAMISTEAAKLDMGHLGWSFHLAGVNVIPCTCVVTLSYLELYHLKHGQLCFTFRV